jgi:nucleoside-triphosphatase THEP1
MNDIIVFTGPVQSGKTTFLRSLFEDRKDVSGFLCPDVNGLRCFFDLNSKELLEFEVPHAGDGLSVINIGKFAFRSDIFAKAKRMISQASDISSSVFIIDEIGKLELKGLGLEPELKKMLHERPSKINTLIVVVRDYLLDDVIKRYSLSDAVVIHIANKEEILRLL